MGETLHGLAAIAASLGIEPQQARYLVKTGQIPVYRLGRTICSTRSIIRDWQAGNEQRARSEYEARAAAN